MKMKSKATPAPRRPINEDAIRDYAYHLYQQTGCIPGRDLENWLEAKACLEANIPKQHAHARLHQHRHPESVETLAIVAVETPASPQRSASAAVSSEEAHVDRLLNVRG